MLFWNFFRFCNFFLGFWLGKSHLRLIWLKFLRSILLLCVNLFILLNFLLHQAFHWLWEVKDGVTHADGKLSVVDELLFYYRLIWVWLCWSGSFLFNVFLLLRFWFLFRARDALLLCWRLFFRFFFILLDFLRFLFRFKSAKGYKIGYFPQKRPQKLVFAIQLYKHVVFWEAIWQLYQATFWHLARFFLKKMIAILRMEIFKVELFKCVPSVGL